MRPPFGSGPPPWRRSVPLALAFTLVALLLSGCASGGQWGRLGLPEGITEESGTTLTLWRGAWAVALAAGVLVWGLIFWAVIFFRRRPGDTGLPAQVRYNMPIEVLYTVTPLIAVAVYFFFTARDQSDLLKLEPLVQGRDHQVNVVGKRWSWDFNYKTEGVYQDGTPGEPPVLYLVRGERVEFELTARDVIHSFWVPAFLIKQDTIPGRLNRFQVTPTKVGTFAGKCAELCGQDHSRMLFTVKVVERNEYDAVIQSLRDRGQIGELPTDIGPKRVAGSQSESESRQ